MKLSTLSTLSLFALFHPLLALAQQQPEYYGPGPWHMWGWGFGWMFPMFLLFAIVACIVMFAFGRSWGGSGHHHLSLNDPTTSALQILNERFAKGEIQKQEYEERKAVILSSRR
jgi:putative membrane protein